MEEQIDRGEEMKDVQSETHGGMEIQKVGVTGVQVPIIVRDKNETTQHVVGTFNLYANLPSHQRGAHMSRFITALEGQTFAFISLKHLQEVMLPIIKGVQEQAKAHIEVSFIYFIDRTPPVTKGMKSKLPVEVQFAVSDYHPPKMGVITPVMTVCPCSLEITDTKQAHSQRAYVRIDLHPTDWVWIEDVAEIASRSGSGWINPLLKRPDEKFIVEYAHKHPRFVEDVARDAARRIREGLPVSWFTVTVESEESIHAHNAFASIEWKDVSVLPEPVTDTESMRRADAASEALLKMARSGVAVKDWPVGFGKRALLGKNKECPNCRKKVVKTPDLTPGACQCGFFLDKDEEVRFSPREHYKV